MKIEDLIREVLFMDDETELTDDTHPDDIEAWDSLGHINIITALEDDFGIEISPEEIDEIESIGDIKALLNAKGIDPE